MKQQVAHLSPHQNGKVFGVLMGIGSLVFLVPFFLLFAAFAPAGASNSQPVFMLVLMPLFYVVFGYVSVALGCLLYNVMFKYLGGIEFEARSESAV